MRLGWLTGELLALGRGTRVSGSSHCVLGDTMGRWVDGEFAIADATWVECGGWPVVITSWIAGSVAGFSDVGRWRAAGKALRVRLESQIERANRRVSSKMVAA